MHLRDGDQETMDIAGDVYKESERLVVNALKRLKINRAPDALYIATQAAVASLQAAACVAGAKNGATEINPVSMLFAALLAAKCCPEMDEFGTSKTEMTPYIIYDAIVATEQLLGRSVDGHLDPNMLRSIRRLVAERDSPNPSSPWRDAEEASLH